MTKYIRNEHIIVKIDRLLYRMENKKEYNTTFKDSRRSWGKEQIDVIRRWVLDGKNTHMYPEYMRACNEIWKQVKKK